MKCFYHPDNDGKCAARIIFEANVIDDYDSEYIPINYADNFPFEKINKDEAVYIVDFSIKPDEMERLLGITQNIVWIDHHKTSINDYVNFPHKVRGMRNTNEAGCILTYRWIHGLMKNEDIEKIPMYIRYIGDRDIWKFEHGDKTRDFCSGIFNLDLSPTSKDWAKLKVATEVYERVGKNINDFRATWGRKYGKTWGYECELDGHKCFVMNMASDSEVAELFTKKHPIVAQFVYKGDMCICTIRSNTIDVSEIAKKRGGGGHKGAAGFSCSIQELPFILK